MCEGLVGFGFVFERYIGMGGNGIGVGKRLRIFIEWR